MALSRRIQFPLCFPQHHIVSGFLKLRSVDISVIEYAYTLYAVGQHPWPLPTTRQQHPLSCDYQKNLYIASGPWVPKFPPTPADTHYSMLLSSNAYHAPKFFYSTINTQCLI